MIFPLLSFRGSQVAPVEKNPPATAGDARDAGLIPGSGRSPGEGNGSPLRHLTWESPQTEQPGGLRPTGSQRVEHHWAARRACSPLENKDLEKLVF